MKLLLYGGLVGAMFAALHVLAKGESREGCTAFFVQGQCTNYSTKWHYAKRTGRCSPMRYGGCGGNENKYDSCTECMTKCSGKNAKKIERFCRKR
uniref:Pancreatic trypsin inhibitor n=1 Tax=Rhipicephalus appendiculatus TaxID=34631 RepID=A0A131YG10_RHIAP